MNRNDEQYRRLIERLVRIAYFLLHREIVDLGLCPVRLEYGPILWQDFVMAVDGLPTWFQNPDKSRIKFWLPPIIEISRNSTLPDDGIAIIEQKSNQALHHFVNPTEVTEFQFEQ